MIFVHVARRAQIGEVLSSRGVPSQRLLSPPNTTDLLRLEPQSVAALWSRDPAEHPELPEVLVTAEGQERDWLAWLVTFLPTLRPFTAFCRVMSASRFIEHSEAFQAPSLGRLERACVGLILGEVLSSDEVQARLREPLTSSACASALSFALVRGLAIHRRPVLHNGDLASRWSLVRGLTHQRERQLPTDHIVAVAAVLEALLRGPSSSRVSLPILHACEELAQRGELAAGTRALSPAFGMTAQEMSGTREERVAMFERALIGSKRANNSQEEAFSLGYLASRINPGTLAHFPLLVPALQQHPSAMLWYGVCAGLSVDSGLLTELGGIGRRVLRDLSMADELVGRPRTDVSAAELDILLAGERADEFPVTSPTQLSVELEPGIWTVVSWSSRMRSRRPQDTGDRPEERGWIASELEATIIRLMELHKRLRGVDPQDRGAGQQNLFGRRPEPRGGRKPSG